MTKEFKYSPSVIRALDTGGAILALESTILAHGMPRPDNLTFAREVEKLVRDQDCVPATIAILDGVIHVGLEDAELERVCFDMDVEKVSIRDLPVALGQGRSGATTVSSTLAIASRAGIKVFATGGIGGVHRGAEYTRDVSADLGELARNPVIVISAGAKAILDLPQTLEELETLGVPVLGYRTDEFPAFYSRSSGLPVPARVDSVETLVKIFQRGQSFGLGTGILVANPVLADYEIPKNAMERWIDEALAAAHDQGIKGKDLTPFLLQHIVKSSDGKSLITNQHLARGNVQLGVEIARALNEA